MISETPNSPTASGSTPSPSESSWTPPEKRL